MFWDYKERGKCWHPCTWSEVRDEEYKITLRRATFYFKDFFTRQRHLQWPKAQPPAIEPFCSKLCMWRVSSFVFLLRALTKGIPHGLPEICLLLHPSTAVFMDPSWLPQLKMATRINQSKKLVLSTLSSSFCVYAFIALEWSVFC